VKEATSSELAPHNTAPDGTCLYMAPEVIQVLEPRVICNKKADVWSCGVLFFWLLAGLTTTTACAHEMECNPFYDTGMSIHALQDNILHREPAWDRLPADLPEDLLLLLKQMLHKQAKLRISARMALSKSLEALGGL
jgi:serine/threonine protein kinase